DRFRVGQEIVELDARRHRRRAAVARDNERAAGIGIAGARVEVLASHPAREEARRKRVACAEHVEHLDTYAAAVEGLIERLGNRAIDDRAAQWTALDQQRRVG